MGNKIYKNYQVTVTNPFKVRNDIVENIRYVSNLNEKENIGNNEKTYSKDELLKSTEDSKRILDEAKFEAERIKKEAYQEGYGIGYDEGYQIAKEEVFKHYENMLEEANFLKERAKEEFENITKNADNHILELSLSIAKKIVSNEIKTDPRTIIPIIKEALGKTSEKRKVEVEISNAYTKEEFNYIEENIKSESNISEIEFKNNNSLIKGDCIVETKFGTIDATIDSKLNSIGDDIKEIINNNTEED